MSAPPDPLVCFGAFQLDRRTGELRKAGVKVNLPDQPFQVLNTLLDHAGDLVTREELRQRLWPAETFVDFEHGLNAAVRRLRDALGDSAEVPRFVETLPRRGYRFIAPVTQQSTGSGPEPSGPAIESERTALPVHDVPAPRLTRMWRPALTAAIVLVSVAILWAAGYLRPSSATPRSPASASRFMLAVLPFENLTGNPDEEYIGDGMTEELIAQLGRIEPSRLGVIARTSAMQFKKTSKRADQIGSDLGVSYVVEGSIRRAGSRVRIAAKLIETRNESQLWADQYERDAINLLTLQREVADSITRQITTHLGVAPSQLTAEAPRHTTIAEAYEQYLRGRYHWSRDTAEGFHKAIAHFRRAIELDPSYALAYTGLADTYTLLGAAGFLPVNEAYPVGKAAASKSLELDDTLSEAHTSLAAITADYYWDWADADRHFNRAIALNPNYETALRFYSFYLACMGRPEEALAFAERARRLNPVSPATQMNVGTILYFARRYDEAIAELEEALELAPDFGPARVMLGRVYVAQGAPGRAVQELERAQSLMGARPDVLTPHAYVLARAGRQREARTMLDGLRQQAKPQAAAPVRVAMVHIGLGEIDRAFEWLEKALEARDWQMAMLNVEPAFDTLRADPRFAALVDRVGLPR